MHIILITYTLFIGYEYLEPNCGTKQCGEPRCKANEIVMLTPGQCCPGCVIDTCINISAATKTKNNIMKQVYSIFNPNTNTDDVKKAPFTIALIIGISFHLIALCIGACIAIYINKYGCCCKKSRIHDFEYL